MKIRILDRILVALAGLLMLAAGAALAAQLFFGKDVAGWFTKLLADDSLRIFLIIGGVLLCLVGIYCVLMLFRHRGKNGKFITQKTDVGELSISLKALESMVTKCLEQHKEIQPQGIQLENQKGSLMIRIRGNVAGGVSIPLTVDTLQQQIKQYVTACSGVEVKEIRVQIESSGEDAKDAPFAIAAPTAPALLKAAADAEEGTAAIPDVPSTEGPVIPEAGAPAAEPEKMPAEEEAVAAAAAAAAALMEEAVPEDDDRPVHQRLFSTVEEPCVMPMPPTAEEAEAAKQEDPAPEAADSRDQTETPETETEAMAGKAEEPEKADESAEPGTEGEGKNEAVPDRPDGIAEGSIDG